jgi:hypothetical protein
VADGVLSDDASVLRAHVALRDGSGSLVEGCDADYGICLMDALPE